MEIVYIIAISLQVCGAIILLLGSFSNTQQEMNKEIVKGGGRAKLSGAQIDGIDISDKFKNVYLNRTAFICLGLGYVLGVFGDIGTASKWVIAASIVILSLCITAILYLICAKVANIRRGIYKDKFKEQIGKNR